MSWRILFAVLAQLALCGNSSAQDACTQCPNLAPSDAWAELAEGNGRFVSGNLKPRADACRRACTKDTQKPYAIVFSCSDSRVPSEIAIDQRIGDLFVVRVAGNVASDEAISSIEYAIDRLTTPKIIVVLGHERCGAVEAALALQPARDLVPGIFNRIFAAISGIEPTIPEESLLTEAVQRNVRFNVKLLPTYSAVIRHAVTDLHVPFQGGVLQPRGMRTAATSSPPAITRYCYSIGNATV
ncbi:MAG TPA: carbonic anhydrase [Bryobacteraceae bacterium]|nr:carbonic anhydrase [Bryobacteraceae bacterium]